MSGADGGDALTACTSRGWMKPSVPFDNLTFTQSEAWSIFSNLVPRGKVATILLSVLAAARTLPARALISMNSTACPGDVFAIEAEEPLGDDI